MVSLPAFGGRANAIQLSTNLGRRILDEEKLEYDYPGYEDELADMSSEQVATKFEDAFREDKPPSPILEQKQSYARVLEVAERLMAERAKQRLH